MAAQANRFKIFLKGKEEVVSGTSGSTPVCVSLLSGSSVLEHPADRQRTDRGGRYLSAQ